MPQPIHTPMPDILPSLAYQIAPVGRYACTDVAPWVVTGVTRKAGPTKNC